MTLFNYTTDDIDSMNAVINSVSGQEGIAKTIKELASTRIQRLERMRGPLKTIIDSKQEERANLSLQPDSYFATYTLSQTNYTMLNQFTSDMSRFVDDHNSFGDSLKQAGNYISSTRSTFCSFQYAGGYGTISCN